jgi:hypothetical protein
MGPAPAGAVTSAPGLLAFISYSRADDRDLRQYITKFRCGLERWVRRYLAGFADGDEIALFQDRDSIGWGQPWRDRIQSALEEVIFFIPIVTPGFFASRECREETSLFLERERQLGRNDLILPVYFIDAVPFENDEPPADDLIAALRSRQYVDWRELKHRRPPSLEAHYEALAQQMANALHRQPSAGAAAVDEPIAMVAPPDPTGPQDSPDGIVAVGSGVLGSGESEEFEIVLLGGVTYDVYVSPADSSVDFDLAVLGPDGQLVAQDLDTDAEALCRITPADTDQYFLRVTSARGSSPYDIAVRRLEPAVIAVGTIRQGESQVVDLVFEESMLYQVAVIADDPSADLDLAVYDENGNKITEDIETTSNALCEFIPLWTGPFRLVVSSARGDSGFALVSL